jgi:hypothetical protein
MIRQLIAVSLLIAGASACESKTVPTPETPENTIRFNVAMTAAQEVPPITGAEANASGTAVITFNLVRNSSNVITSGTVDFAVTLAGFPAGTAINAAHIHPGFVGTTGGVSVNTLLNPGELTLTTGSGSFSRTQPNVGVDVLAAIIANPQAFYFNVHSASNPGGAVRGQLVKQ